MVVVTRPLCGVRIVMMCGLAPGYEPWEWQQHRETFAARFRQKRRAEWEHELKSPGACATPVLSISGAFEDETAIADLTDAGVRQSRKDS